MIDSLTRRMVAAWRARRSFEAGYRGLHRCKCGMRSDNRRHWVIANDVERETNSLCVHYVAIHRAHIPKCELVKLEGITQEELEPTEAELGIVRKVEVQPIFRFNDD